MIKSIKYFQRLEIKSDQWQSGGSIMFKSKKNIFIYNLLETKLLTSVLHWKMYYKWNNFSCVGVFFFHVKLKFRKSIFKWMKV